MVRFFNKPGISIVSLFIIIMTQTFSSNAQGLLREYWSGISGTSVSDLTGNANYPNTPTSRNVITVFEGPINTADNYGTRIRGYVVPPTTGNYTFWISSDDNSELWLSTSADPAGKTLIASVSGYTNSREWTKFSSQQSSARTLTAGQRYYIEVLHKDGTGGDNVAVGWQGPGITGDAERPIPASRLVPYEAGLLREVWTGISGTAVSNLTSSPNYPSTPNQSQTIYSFEAPVDNADNYGTRIRGYVVPPTTGSYTFWIASDDNSELWLSNSADPAGKSLIASVTDWTNSREWTKYSSQQSTARTLTAGQKYYVEVLHKEGGGGDNVAVGWQGPGITGETERPIPVSRLLAWTGGNPTYTLTINNDGNGTTNPTGNLTVNAGTATAIAATAASGYAFRSWSVTSGTATFADSLSASTTVTLNSSNATVRANFTAQTYTLTMSNDGNGTTTPVGSITVNQGAATAITATPSGGYVFRSWSITAGTATFADSLSASTTVTLNSSNATVRANFTLQTYILTMTNDSHGTTTPSGSIAVIRGTLTTITATPATGYVFRSWSVTAGTATIGDSLSANTTASLNSGSATLRANFVLRTYSLTMSNDGNGTTTPTGTVTVNHGVATAISATAASGYIFRSWSVISGTASFADSLSASTTVTLNSGNATIRANFTIPTYTLTMTNDSHGTTTPSGSVTVVRGTATTISATPATGYVFSSWSVISGTATIADSLSASTTVTLNSSNATLRANFTLRTYSLTINNDGNGTTTPSGTVTVNHGTATVIAASPASGYVFRSWSITSGTAIIADTLSASTSVTLNSGNATLRANFTLRTYTLSITNDGHGTTSPTGPVTVIHGTATAISAAAVSGYYFLNWTVTSGTATIANPAAAATTITLTSGNATIRANFTLQMDTLSISNNGNGTTTPSGRIAIGRGVAFPISATAATGYHFVNWSIISGTPQIANPSSASTTVTLLNGNGAIQANFTENTAALPNNRQISITGALYDASGNPVGSPQPVSLDMKVCLFSQATEGTPVYSENFLVQNNQSIQVINGNFVVRLGTGVTGDTLVNVITTNNNLWAEITVLDGDPDVLQPRTPLTASPYSISGIPAQVKP
jgi:hypothetical protein